MIVKERAGEALESGEPKKLVEILIEMARASGEAQQVDAEVQIVLAVLLNAMEASRFFANATAYRPTFSGLSEGLGLFPHGTRHPS